MTEGARVEREELVVKVMLKPNCGLENTRASLVVRRIAPLCDAVSCHPRTVKSDRATISFLRDHGLFIRFDSPTPEQVLLAIKDAFFVDSCTIVEDLAAIPAYEAKGGGEFDAESPAFALPSLFANVEPGEHDDELTGLLARFEDAHRELRAHAGSAPADRALNGILFSHAQAIDGLRTAVARSRIEPFERIAPSLRTLVADFSSRFGVQVDLDIADGHMALDRSVLASMEEIIKRIIRSCLRDGIEGPEERVAAGKPPRAMLRLRLESDGAEVACHIEHDGRLFDARLIGRQAVQRGLLARPLETYSDEEIGSLILLPGFIKAGDSEVSKAFSQFNEAGSMLQHVGGRGSVRNTDQGTLEISLRFPVPFTVMEAALLRTGGTRFALPAQQISRFEAYRPERVDESGPASRPARYLTEGGGRLELLNGPRAANPLEAKNPTFVLTVEAAGKRQAFAVDAVDGYERISVRQLPALLDRKTAREAGCFGYAVLADGTACAVASVRLMLSASLEEGGRRA